VFPSGNRHPAEVIRPEGRRIAFELPNLPETYHLDEIAERIKWRLERFVWRVRSVQTCGALGRQRVSSRASGASRKDVGSRHRRTCKQNKQGGPAGPPFSFFLFRYWIGY
jgi:hypothetical protein